MRSRVPARGLYVTKPCSVVPYALEDGRCDLCGHWLVGRQKRWCGKKCALAYRRQHSWTHARTAARRRDGYRCRHCGTGRENPECHLEVNHIMPLNGKGYGWSCAHHLENLEVLCRACHRKVTAKQRAERKAAAA